MADITVAFFISVLCGLGVGGGGLLVIWLTLVMNVPQIEAQGINLIFFIASALSALSVNLKKRKFDFFRLLLLAVPGIVFAILGSLTASAVDPSLVRKCFGALMCLSGVLGLLPKKEKENARS